MTSLSFLIDLAWVVALGSLAAAVFQRLKQPLVLGYLFAGLLLNEKFPYLPNLLHFENIHLLAELGVVFIMFFVGLHFNFRKLRQVGAGVFLAGLTEVVLVLYLGYFVAEALGYPVKAAIVFGALFCTASTTIIAKSLQDEGMMKEDFAGVVIGITLVEDLAAIAILVFLSGLADPSASGWGYALAALGKVAAFSLGSVVLGLLAVPRLMRWVDRVGTPETMGLAALGFCLVASASAASLGISTALGAFLAGAVISESGLNEKIEGHLASVRDLFLAVFFVTVGLQFKVPVESGSAWLLLLALLTALVGRSVSTALGALVAGYDFKSSVHAALSLTAIGELSFVIASLGVTAGVAPASFFSATVVVSTALVFLTPYFIRKGGDWAAAWETFLPGKIRIFLSRYQSWVQALRWPVSRFKVPSKMYPLLARGAAVLVLMAGVVALDWYLNRWQAVNGWTTLAYEGDLALAREAASAVVFAGLFLVFLATVRRVFRHVLKEGGGKLDPRGRSMLVAAEFFAAAVTGGLFLALAAPFIPAWTLAVAVVGILLAQAGLLRQALARMESRLDSLVEALAAPTGGEALDRGEVKALVMERYPWQAKIADFMLPPVPCAANTTLRSLGLRRKTGATVVAVYRDETILHNPGAELRLQPSDVLVLLGEKEHLESASHYLAGVCRSGTSGQSPDPPGVRLATVTVTAGSSLIGLGWDAAENGLAEGAHLVAVERGGIRLDEPPLEGGLRPGDVVFLTGRSGPLREAREKLLNETPTK